MLVLVLHIFRQKSRQTSTSCEFGWTCYCDRHPGDNMQGQTHKRDSWRVYTETQRQPFSQGLIHWYVDTLDVDLCHPSSKLLLMFASILRSSAVGCFECFPMVTQRPPFIRGGNGQMTCQPGPHISSATVVVVIMGASVFQDNHLCLTDS